MIKSHEIIYACPNCGHNFKKSTSTLILSWLFTRRYIVETIWKNDKEYLKCSECKVKDYCRIK